MGQGREQYTRRNHRDGLQDVAHHVYRQGETVKVPFMDIMRVSNPM